MIAGAQQSENRGVIAFRASGIEHHLGSAAIEELCQRLAGLVDGRVRLLPVQVNRRGIAEMLHPIGAHRFHHLWQQRRGSIGVHVDSGHRGFSSLRLYVECEFCVRLSRAPDRATGVH